MFRRMNVQMLDNYVNVERKNDISYCKKLLGIGYTMCWSSCAYSFFLSLFFFAQVSCVGRHRERRAAGGAAQVKVRTQQFNNYTGKERGYDPSTKFRSMGTVGCYPQTLNQFVHHNKQYHVKVLFYNFYLNGHTSVLNSYIYGFRLNDVIRLSKHVREIQMITSTSSAPRNRISDRSPHVLTKALRHSILPKVKGTTPEAETEERVLEGRVGFQLVGHPCM